MDFNDKVRFFDFENEERSRSNSRETSLVQDEVGNDMTILDEDLTMTPNKDLKKAQVWVAQAYILELKVSFFDLL